MNMSGHYRQYYQPFGPRSQGFGQQNQPYRQPYFPPNNPHDYPLDYNPIYPPNDHLQAQNFPEYSLWGTSPYNPSEMIHTAINGPSVFGNLHLSPPYPPPALFCAEKEESNMTLLSEQNHTGPGVFGNNHSPTYLSPAVFRAEYEEKPLKMESASSELNHTGPGVFLNHHQYSSPAVFASDFIEKRLKMESPDLNHTVRNGPGVFRNQHNRINSPPYSQSAVFNADFEIKPLKMESTELTHTAKGSGVFGNHHSPPYPTSSVFNADFEIKTLKMEKPPKMESVSELNHTAMNGRGVFGNHHSPVYPTSTVFNADFEIKPLKKESPELSHTTKGPRVFGNHHSPPYPTSSVYNADYELKPPKMESVSPNVTQIKEEAVGGSDEPELTGLEEPEKITVAKEDLYRYYENDVSDDENIDTIEQTSNSSGSSGSDWTNTNFQRAGAYSSYPWASRPSRMVNNRGKKANVMQRRLVRALSQPVKMDKGASMMQRMGWMGGGLGREESGIVSPVAPNAVYASTTAGFGQDVARTFFQDLSTKTPTQKSKKKRNISFVSKRARQRTFKTNVLKSLLAFLKNDMMLELYFDSKLGSSERKRIHRIVARLDGREETDEVDTPQQEELVKDITHRNHYALTTLSEGDHPDRQICVYKSAPNHLYLVTPDDCRPCHTDINEVEEESNPFMKSIAKHIRKDEGTILKPRPPQLFDKLVEFFIDFCADDTFSEFRFLGPFTKKEVYVVNFFICLIEDLALKHKPDFKCPVELLDVFATDYHFRTHLDPNGFTAIKKEVRKQQQEQLNRVIVL